MDSMDQDLAINWVTGRPAQRIGTKRSGDSGSETSTGDVSGRVSAAGGSGLRADSARTCSAEAGARASTCRSTCHDVRLDPASEPRAEPPPAPGDAIA